MSSKEQRKAAKDVGAGSPGSEESKRQGHTGVRGAEAEGGAAGGQPPQTSNRRPAEHEQPRPVRKSFAPGEAPSEQGDMSEPGAERIKQHQQGMQPRSGSHAGGDRSEEAAASGEPAGPHVRSGRQKIPGERKREV